LLACQRLRYGTQGIYASQVEQDEEQLPQLLLNTVPRKLEGKLTEKWAVRKGYPRFPRDFGRSVS